MRAPQNTMNSLWPSWINWEQWGNKQQYNLVAAGSCSPITQSFPCRDLQSSVPSTPLSNISVKPPGETASNPLNVETQQTYLSFSTNSCRTIKTIHYQGAAEVKPKPGIQWWAEENSVKSLQLRTDPGFVALRYTIPTGHRSEVFLDFTLTLYFHTETLLNDSVAASALCKQRATCISSMLRAAHESLPV